MADLFFRFFYFAGCIANDVYNIYIIIQGSRPGMALNKIPVEGFSFTWIPAAKPEYFFSGHKMIKIAKAGRRAKSAFKNQPAQINYTFDYGAIEKNPQP